MPTTSWTSQSLITKSILFRTQTSNLSSRVSTWTRTSEVPKDRTVESIAVRKTTKAWQPRLCLTKRIASTRAEEIARARLTVTSWQIFRMHWLPIRHLIQQMRGTPLAWTNRTLHLQFHSLIITIIRLTKNHGLAASETMEGNLLITRLEPASASGRSRAAQVISQCLPPNPWPTTPSAHLGWTTS